MAWDVSNDYLSWPVVTDFCIERHNGLLEKRKGALIDIDREDLKQRMMKYYDATVSWGELETLDSGLTKSASRFDPEATRQNVLRSESFREDRLLHYSFHPFDVRWCYYSEIRPLWNETRPELWKQNWTGNAFFVTRPGCDTDPEGVPVYFTSLLGDNDFQRGHSYYFPVQIKVIPEEKRDQPALLGQDEPVIKANLSQKARAYLAALGIHNPDSDPEVAALIWRHALAIGYSPAYREEHEEGIKNDWPRIPLPNDVALLRASSGLGAQVADLLDTEKSLLHITAGGIRDDLRLLGRQQGHDLAVRANWGYADSRGAVMPGGGDARQRPYTDEEREAIERGAAALNIELDAALTLLGDTTFDLYLNETTCWSNVPANVYGYTIGGYQVIKKWLSYRNADVLGRALTGDEVREVTQMVRRLAALILLEPQLNSNYRDVKANVYEWGQE